MNNLNFMFFMTLVFSSLMIIFNKIWFIMWIYLEINLISFIYLMMNYKNYSCFESSLIYFLIQTIASILFLFSMFFMNFYKYMNIIIMISMFMKMGMSPFHFWLIMMIDSLNWILIYFLLTWQKIAPLMLFYYYNKMNFINYFLLLSIIIGSLGLNYSSMKKILAYSSINQLSWLLISMMFLNKIFKLYFLMYMYMMMITIFSFNMFNLKYIYNFMVLKLDYYLMFLFCNLLSLGGLPPFIGFFPKMMIIKLMSNSTLMIILITATLISLFYYLRIMITSMMINNKMINSFMKLNQKINKKFMMILMISNLTMMLFIFIY